MVGVVVRHLPGGDHRQPAAEQVVELDVGRQPLTGEGPRAHPTLAVGELGVVEAVGEVAEARVAESGVEVPRQHDGLAGPGGLHPRLQGPQARAPLVGVARQRRRGVGHLQPDGPPLRRHVELGLDTGGVLPCRLGTEVAQRDGVAREHHRPRERARSGHTLAPAEVVVRPCLVEAAQHRRCRLGEDQHVDRVVADGLHELVGVGRADPHVGRHHRQVGVGLRGRRPPEGGGGHRGRHRKDGDDGEQHPPPAQQEGGDHEQAETHDDEGTGRLEDDDGVCRGVDPAQRADYDQPEQEEADGEVEPAAPATARATAPTTEPNTEPTAAPTTAPVDGLGLPGAVGLLARHLRPAARPG